MEKEFIDWVERVIQKADEKVCQANEAARIDLIFMKKFKSTLMNHINSNIGKKEIRFEKTEVLQKEDNYNIRSGMDDDLINEVARKGYIYRGDLSSSDCLVFQQGNTLEIIKK